MRAGAACNAPGHITVSWLLWRHLCPVSIDFRFEIVCELSGCWPQFYTQLLFTVCLYTNHVRWKCTENNWADCILFTAVYFRFRIHKHFPVRHHCIYIISSGYIHLGFILTFPCEEYCYSQLWVNWMHIQIRCGHRYILRSNEKGDKLHYKGDTDGDNLRPQSPILSGKLNRG